MEGNGNAASGNSDMKRTVAVVADNDEGSQVEAVRSRILGDGGLLNKNNVDVVRGTKEGIVTADVLVVCARGGGDVQSVLKPLGVPLGTPQCVVVDKIDSRFKTEAEHADLVLEWSEEEFARKIGQLLFLVQSDPEDNSENSSGEEDGYEPLGDRNSEDESHVENTAIPSGPQRDEQVFGQARFLEEQSEYLDRESRIDIAANFLLALDDSSDSTEGNNSQSGSVSDIDKNEE